MKTTGSIQRARNTEDGGGWTGYFLITILALLVVLPVVWMFGSAFKPAEAAFEYPPRLLPIPASWETMQRVLVLGPWGRWFLNTLVYIGIGLAGILFTSSMAGYSFARLSWRGRGFWFSAIVATMLLPASATLVPSFILFSKLGMVGSLKPLWVPLCFGGSAFNVFLFHQFYQTVPVELEQAAYIDGCGPYSAFWRIIFPLSKSSALACSVLFIVYAWNDFTGPLVYLNKMESFTMVLGITMTRTYLRSNPALTLAASTLVAAPMVLLFFIAQRYFMDTMIYEGIKG